MKIFCKLDNKLHEVYSIRCDKVGFPQFLIYINHEWKWISAKNFTPIDTDDTDDTDEKEKKEEIEEYYCRLIKNIDCRDTEEAHVDADRVLCDCLLDLGYKKLISYYRDVPKWYC